MTRVLFIGDPHIKPDNGEEIDILLHEIERVFSSKKYDTIVIGGDVMHYHERLFTQALNKALEFIQRISSLAFTYILVGNHDAINNSIFLTDQHWMNALKTWDRVKVVDTVVVEKDMILCPYVPPGRFVEALRIGMKNIGKNEDDWKNGSICLFAHQEFKGCKMEAILSEDGDQWGYEYPTIVSGHIHDRQQVGENIYYPGSPLQHSYGDSDKRFLCDIEYIDKNVNIDFVTINVPVRKIIKATSCTLQDVVSHVKKLNNENNKIKIKLESTPEEFSIFKNTKEYKDLINSGIKFQLIKSSNILNKENSNKEDTKNEFDFQHILEDLIKTDDEHVQHLYNELFLEKLVIEL